MKPPAARVFARPLTASSTVAFTSVEQRSEEFSTGTSGEISTGIDTMWFKPSIPVTDCRDPTDNKYLELALAAQAATIVSSDQDLLILHPWCGVLIQRPADYLAREAPLRQ